jgi:lipoprotein-anchoring transpeptidase ErfK/SrfK
VSRRRLLARLTIVLAFACFGLVALAATPAGGGKGATFVPSAATPPAPDAPAQSSSQPAQMVPPPPHRPRFLIGLVTRPVVTAAGAISPATRLGGPTWLLILRRKGNLGMALVPTPTGPKPALVPLAALNLRWTRVRIDIDLSSLRMTVLRGRHALGEFSIAAGMSSTPTPTGLFSVTDRVSFSVPGTYGSFALGLSARQSHLLSGWQGGDQIAIHGTEHPESIGTHASLGCIRVSETALRLLRGAVPLGAPVFIHA